jgi:sucrose-6-phosphate hydrolase SacC (GH32 family)
VGVDFWLADDGRNHHLFFLSAPKALGDPEARHANASIGHAVSTDLRHWTRLDDALAHGLPGQFDSLATWTGSVVRHPDGSWVLFYTGVARADRGLVQSIGYATSPDLVTWTRSPRNPVLLPDGVLYEDGAATGDTAAFRDPWVFPAENGGGWHMLLTASARHGAPQARGVVGHAWSPDLASWQLRPALSEPGQGFGVLEVLQLERVQGRAVLLFSCPADETVAPIRPAAGRGDVWAVVAESPTGPYPISTARQVVDDDGRYGGRIAFSRRDQRWVFQAFDRDPGSPTFLQIGDPRPVHRRGAAVWVGT